MKYDNKILVVFFSVIVLSGFVDFVILDYILKLEWKHFMHIQQGMYLGFFYFCFGFLLYYKMDNIYDWIKRKWRRKWKQKKL